MFAFGNLWIVFSGECYWSALRVAFHPPISAESRVDPCDIHEEACPFITSPNIKALFVDLRGLRSGALNRLSLIWIAGVWSSPRVKLSFCPRRPFPSAMPRWAPSSQPQDSRTAKTAASKTKHRRQERSWKWALTNQEQDRAGLNQEHLCREPFLETAPCCPKLLGLH